MEIIGYKCFNKDMTNRYGTKFEVGKMYEAKGNIVYGNNGNGFHMAERLEDTLRYFCASEEEISICLVKGSGQIVASFDDYYGYYDIYSVQRLEIQKKLSREEIIEFALKLHNERARRFISGFKLTPIEIELFKQRYNKETATLAYIEYYQEKKEDVFCKQRKKY